MQENGFYRHIFAYGYEETTLDNRFCFLMFSLHVSVERIYNEINVCIRRTSISKLNILPK